MMIKLVIIGAVLLGGGIIFVSETNQSLPELSTNIFDSTKKDLNQMKDTTETTIDAGVKTVSDGVSDFAESIAGQLSEGVKRFNTIINGVFSQS
jgi:3-hydroxyacyl-CoA dehydrogenase